MKLKITIAVLTLMFAFNTHAKKAAEVRSTASSFSSVELLKMQINKVASNVIDLPAVAETKTCLAVTLIVGQFQVLRAVISSFDADSEDDLMMANIRIMELANVCLDGKSLTPEEVKSKSNEAGRLLTNLYSTLK